MPFSNNFYDTAFNGGADPLIELIRANVDGNYYYYANNTEDIFSNVDGGNATYLRSSFKLTLPEDTTEGTPQATLEFGAGDIELVRMLRNAQNRIIVDMWVVLGSDPNYIEYGPANYESESFSVNGSSISLKLVAEPILDVAIPSKRYTPSTFPQLWP